jgi:trimeric autotransporter adhesin
MIGFGRHSCFIETKPKITRRIDMKSRTTLIITAAIVLCAVARLTLAQCPQNCDSSSFSTAIGNNALPNPNTQCTAVGDSALFNNGTYGIWNTAVGASAAYSNVSGVAITAVGLGACSSNTDGVSNTAIGFEALLLDGGSWNTAVGESALWAAPSGSFNTAVGAEAMEGTETSNASNNTAVGFAALGSYTTGSDNTATGYQALYYNQTGSSNTAYGENSMRGSSTTVPTGSNNTAMGTSSLKGYTSGSSNTAIGYASLFFDTTGNFNTATGRGALYKNTTASNNVATGYQALNVNQTGANNTATGTQALQNNVGSSNTATGYQSMNKNTTGANNVAIGNSALYSNTSGTGNTAIGISAGYFTTGSNNIAIGLNAGTGVFSGSNNIDIGSGGASESNTIRIGTTTQTNTYIAGINGVTVAGGIGVIVDSSGHLGTSTSSARYKQNIQPMDKASEAILSLQPVTFRYKKELDLKGIPQFGLVAEQVDKVDPNLVVCDEQGKPFSVRYEAVNAMLLNEFLKEHRKVEDEATKNREQDATIRELKSAIAEQQKEIRALSAGLQKVSNRLELAKPTDSVVMNNP